MIATALKQAKIAFLLLLLLSMLTGLIYPAIVTCIAQFFFPTQANGSLIMLNHKRVGSELIGQNFTDTKYFWGRPSATTPFAYNAQNSSGSNLGPSNPDLVTAVTARINTLHKIDPQNKKLIPIDLVTSSASGLDPEISPLAAFYQVPRVAKARGIAEAQLNNLVQKSIKNRTFGILGEPRINVLLLNLALDNLTMHKE
ncbi:MAG: potassium-transporting ATPase subunit KdpC [Gammaproteobacteria bacterium]